jgi:hypothetical protein
MSRFAFLLLLLLFPKIGANKMPNDFYSGATTVLPVIHKREGEGVVHNIEVPTDLPVADLLQGLLDSGYHGTGEAPTEAGAGENTERFRAAAKQSRANAASGSLRKEAGFIDYKNRLQERDQTEPSRNNELEQRVPKSAFATVHTHSNERQPDPSDANIQVAKKIGKPLNVISRSGLF